MILVCVICLNDYDSLCSLPILNDRYHAVDNENPYIEVPELQGVEPAHPTNIKNWPALDYLLRIF